MRGIGVLVRRLASVGIALALAGCSRAAGDYFDAPPGQVLTELEAMEIDTAGALPGTMSQWREGESIHWAVTVSGQRIAVFHATVTPDGKGSRVLLVEDAAEPLKLPAGGSPAFDKLNQDVSGVLGSRLNHGMAKDFLREKIAATLEHRPPSGLRTVWGTAQRIQRDASAMHDFADKVDELQTDAMKAAWEAQKSEADAEDGVGDIERSYRARPSQVGQPSPGVGRPTLDTTPSHSSSYGER